MIGRFDNWLLDRWFQPLADRFGPASHGIARWLLRLGFESQCLGLALLILTSPRWWQAAVLVGYAVLLAAIAAWLFSFSFGHQCMMRHGAPSALASRDAWRFARHPVLAAALSQVLLVFPGGDLLARLFLLLGAAGWVGCVCLASCSAAGGRYATSDG
jgi:protein-S-isoprenylcysteine O-methyltransferase Ste14